MKIGIAQINTTVGDFAGNAEKILQATRDLESRGAEVVLTPELSLTGYPPQDLLFKSDFVPGNLDMLEVLHKEVGKAALLVGCVERNATGKGRPFFNAAAVLEKDKPLRKVCKSLLPTYDVFDEARYFEPGPKPMPLEIAGHRLGVAICEDIWTPEFLPAGRYPRDPVHDLVAAGAGAILTLSASPFQMGKPALRREMIRRQAGRHRVPFFYCNAVGGNDQLVFDGSSLAVTADGVVWVQAPGFSEGVFLLDIGDMNHAVEFTPLRDAPGVSQRRVSILNPWPTETSPRDDLADLRDALVLGLKDYMGKCGFRTAVLGLSGGIDSAVTACIAVQALGADNVLGVAMPSEFSSAHSIEDAIELAKNLGMECLQIPIKKSFEAFKDQMAPAFSGRVADLTEENMQARLRGLTLMALSNKFGHLLLTTGNKSELAVGYCTLYGDMCGGLAVLSDLPKTMVYKLADFLNQDARHPLIPERTITKPPSAELRPDQTDQDTLPPYEILDEILRLHVEENLGLAGIVQNGFDAETVGWVIRQVDRNEYKRGQAAPGLKVTGRAFGIGRRMPLAQKFLPSPVR
ncbi:MAG: NAD+ synthase [Chthoniobacterales bacterium]|nr:NAD+ synthase [Chthoniobacterales bacterium]